MIIILFLSKLHFKKITILMLYIIFVYIIYMNNTSDLLNPSCKNLIKLSHLSIKKEKKV